MGRGILRNKGTMGGVAVNGKAEGSHMVVDAGFDELTRMSLAKEMPDSKMAARVGPPVLIPGQDTAMQYVEQQERKVRSTAR